MDRSLEFQVPHDLEILEYKPSLRSTRKHCHVLCLPFDGPGGVLHNGRLFITSIGGFFRHEEGNWLRNVSNHITYLDFESRQIKFDMKLSIRRMRQAHMHRIIFDWTRSHTGHTCARVGTLGRGQNTFFLWEGYES